MADLIQCPECGSTEPVRSHRRGTGERLRSWLLGSRPFRCRECGHRFWKRVPDGPKGVWHWLAGILAVIVLAAVAFHFWTPSTDRQGLPEPAPPAIVKPGQPDAVGKPAAQPETGPSEQEIPAEARKLLDALAKAPAPPPEPPPPPPPVQQAEIPPVRPGHVVVPAMVGYAKSYAKWVLARQGLRYQGMLRGPVSVENHGQVFAQDPPPGQVVPLGSDVTVRSFVAKPEEVPQAKAVVPNLSGLRAEQAELAVRRAGLIPMFSPVLVKDRRWDGLVAGQTPAPGEKTDLEGAVRVRVYSSDPPLEVPFLIGQRLSYAKWLLTQMGFRYKVVMHGPVKDRPHEQVFGQDPNPGSIISPGSLVEVRAYQAPEGEREEPPSVVPPVAGLSYPMAEDSLRRAGLVPDFQPTPTTDSARYWLVADQAPRPGMALKPYTQVRVKIWAPADPRRGGGRVVPVLVGFPLSYARWALARRNLTLRERFASPAAGRINNQVYRQSVPPGQVVPKGSQITVLVYQAPEGEAERQMATMPKVERLDKATAEDILRRNGLEPMFSTEQTDDTRLKGLVASQEPPAGQKLIPGSRVTVWMYR